MHESDVMWHVSTCRWVHVSLIWLVHPRFLCHVAPGTRASLRWFLPRTCHVISPRHLQWDRGTCQPSYTWTTHVREVCPRPSPRIRSSQSGRCLTSLRTTSLLSFWITIFRTLPAYTNNPVTILTNINILILLHFLEFFDESTMKHLSFLGISKTSSSSSPGKQLKESKTVSNKNSKTSSANKNAVNNRKTSDTENTKPTSKTITSKKSSDEKPAKLNNINRKDSVRKSSKGNNLILL